MLEDILFRTANNKQREMETQNLPSVLCLVQYKKAAAIQNEIRSRVIYTSYTNNYFIN